MSELKLRSWLILLLVAAIMLTFSAVGSMILLYRLPQIEARNRAELQERAASASRLLDHYTAGIEEQIRTLARLAGSKPRAEMQAYLDAMVGDGATFAAAFLISADGSPVAVGLPGRRKLSATELLGADFSANPLFQAARASLQKGGPPAAIWSDKYLSELSGQHAVGIALTAADKVIIGEVSLERILNLLRNVAPNADSPVLVIDRQGQWLASSNDASTGRNYNSSALPAFQAVIAGRPLPEYETIQGQRLLFSAVLSKNLQWVIGAAAPAGMGGDSYFKTIMLVVGGFAGSLVMSMLLAPLWAARMSRPLNALIDRTHRVIDGDYGTPWPQRGSIVELNQLSRDIAHMVDVIQTREAAVARSEERLRATLESTPSIAVQWFDGAGRVLYWNKASERMYGYTAAEAVDSVVGEDTLLMYLDRQQAESVTAAFAEIGRSGQPFGPAEFALRRKDGSDVVVLGTAFAIPGDGGKNIYVCMDVDITAQKQAESEIRRLNADLEDRILARTADLEAANRSLELAKSQAEAASVAKSAFLANMSHEIRTPMNGIIGMASILRREGVSPQQATRLDVIDTSAQHLLSVINNILDLSKIEAGKFTLDEAGIDVGSLLANVSSILADQVKVKGIRLLIEAGAMPSALIGDPTRLQQALLNYATNAVKFTERGAVTLRALKQQETEHSVTLRFEVKDDGIGIAPDALGRLFSAFEQADNTMTRRYGGTGLGLAITRRLAELMGGEAGAESTVGVGSTFWFTAKLRKGDAAPASLPQGAVDAEAEIRRRYSGRRILVVDDEPMNQEIARIQLEDAGFVVDTADDGATAITMARDNNYAAIFMDMQMPTMNGLEATQEIRQLPACRNTPIIAMTANAFAEDRARCLDAGMNDFLTKPFKPDLFFAILLGSLSRHDSAPG